MKMEKQFKKTQHVFQRGEVSTRYQAGQGFYKAMKLIRTLHKTKTFYTYEELVEFNEARPTDDVIIIQAYYHIDTGKKVNDCRKETPRRDL
jgi:hypothetical protein